MRLLTVTWIRPLILVRRNRWLKNREVGPGVRETDDPKNGNLMRTVMTLSQVILWKTVLFC
jgi:hypothetical protein